MPEKQWKSRIHAAVRHPDRAEVLVQERKDHFRLPVSQQEDIWLSMMNQIAPIFVRKLGAPLWGLRLIYSRSSKQARVNEAVVEFEVCDPDWVPPQSYRWAGLDEFQSKPLLPQKIQQAVRAYLDERLTGHPHPLRPPWAQPGWRETVRVWLARAVEERGYTLQDVLQVKQWGISCVLQVKTSGPDFFFKTTNRFMPLFVNEARMTQELSARFPAFVPGPIAVRESEDWMLLPAFDRPLTGEADERVLPALYRRFASLQVQALAELDSLLASGALDRRLPVLAHQLEGLLTDPAVLERMDRKSRQDLQQAAPRFRDLLQRLAALEIPDTLVHGDLHGNNAAYLDGRMVFYDWTDACIGCPFFDLQSVFHGVAEELQAPVMEAYLEPWKAVVPEDRLREGLRIARAVLHLHHAVSYQHITANLEPLSKPELDIAHLILIDAIKMAKDL